MPICAVFEDPTKPLLMDFGCARGACVMHLAKSEPEWNFLGIETRETLVTEALQEASPLPPFFCIFKGPPAPFFAVFKVLSLPFLHF